LFASGQKLEFDKIEHHFRQIKETNGEVKCVFFYENKSKSPIIIVAVENTNRSSVRITAKNNDTLQPKGKGEVSVTLNPRNLSGNFEHTITVKTIEDGKNHNYLLKIKADIEPRPRTKQEIYGMKEGNLRYKTNSKHGYKLTPNTILIDTFFFYNEWEETMTFSTGNLPAAIEIVYLTPKTAPLEEGILVFRFKAGLKNDWGNVYDRFTMHTNDPERPDKTFHIAGDIYDDFASWTPEQLKNAPKVQMSEEKYNFGTATEDENVEHTFTITNVGKSKLYIRKIKGSCSCTVVQPEKNELEAGESTTMKAVFRTHGKTGGQSRTADVITNDPERPKITLTLEGHVRPKPTTE
jgi:hypothetical protein